MELVHEQEYKGFDIRVSIAPEDTEPDWDMTDEERKQLLYDIDSGKLLWFWAKVEAYKHGVLLGDDSLGGCCYPSIDEFLTDPYYSDMLEQAVNEANEKLKLLCSGA